MLEVVNLELHHMFMYIHRFKYSNSTKIKHRAKSHNRLCLVLWVVYLLHEDLKLKLQLQETKAK